MPDLKPCPFCGSDNVSYTPIEEQNFEDHVEGFIWCHGCNFTSDVFLDLKFAKEKWNRRGDHMDDRLRSALEGIELTEREERYLEWLSRMDGETVEVFSGLFEKIREADRERLLKKMFPLGMPDNGNYGINAKAVWKAIKNRP